MTLDDPNVKAIQDEIIATRKQRDIDYEEYIKQDRIWGLVPKDRITKITFPRVPQDIVKRYLALMDMTAAVADILDSMGYNTCVSASHITPIKPGQKICGPACTLRNLPEQKTVTQGYHDKDFIKMSTRDSYYIAEPGDVLCVDFAGNLDCSCMGEMSCTVGKTWGLAGNIVNGCVRDVPSILELDYPVWSVGRTMLTGKFRTEAMELNGPINFCGIRINPGDLVCADDSGIAVVPYAVVNEVLEGAEAVMAEEAVLHPMISKKGPLDDIRPLVRKRYATK